MRRPGALVITMATLALSSVSASAHTLVADPLAQGVQALGGAVTWLHVEESGYVTTVALAYRIDGVTHRARTLPGGDYTRHGPEVFGDLGLNARGHPAQLISSRSDYLSTTEGPTRSARFWAYDLITGRAPPLVLPELERGCAPVAAAILRRRTAVIANCAGTGALYLDRGTGRARRLLSIARLDRFAFTRTGIDVGPTAVALNVEFKPCSEPAANGEPCPSTTGDPGRTDVWLARDGCRPRLLRQSSGAGDLYGTPQLVAGRVFLLESHHRVATLHARTLLGGCGLGRDAIVLRIGTWNHHVDASVDRDSVYVSRDAHGIQRVPLAG